MLGLVALSILCVPVPAQKPPTKRQCEKLIQAFVTSAPHSEERTRSEKAMTDALARVPELKPSDVKSWRKKILSYHKKGRKLAKSGRNWFDEKQKRGLYYVGGKTKRPQGLLIGLHGGGEGAGDASSSFRAYESAASKLGLALVCPEVLVKSELGWTTDGTEEWVLELVDCALRTWKIDPSRVFLTGHSMGGYGSWSLGAHHADRIAGIAPSAGAPTPIFDIRDRSRIIDVQQGVIANLRNVRTVIFQSTDDPRVPPAPNQFAVKLLKEAKARWGGYDFEYLEVDDRGHGFPKGGPSVLLEKIRRAVRNPVPERITWQPALPWKRQFYWLWWDAPILEAIVVADLDRASGRVAIRCEKEGRAFEPEGLRVLLDERVVDWSKEFVVTVNGKERFRGKPLRSLLTLARTGVHPDPVLMFESMVPPRVGALSPSK